MADSIVACEIIAEGGVNHDGDEAEALRLVEAAAGAGADTVKFQTFDPDELAIGAAPSADYQRAAGEGDRQADMLRRLVLSEGALRAVARRAETLGIGFLSTPFDIASARFLVDTLGMSRIKVGSGELTNLPLLLALARLGPPLLLSTGMANQAEVEDALGTIVFGRIAPAGATPSLGGVREAYRDPRGREVIASTVVMQCVTQYPAPHDQANLLVLDTYAALGAIPGYSDHTLGIDIALAAIARGARVIEKHLTLDRTRPGPDHRASLEPDEMAALTAGARRVVAALGSPDKRPVPAETANLAVARRVLVASCAIRTGEPLGPHNVVARRAGGGLAPGRLWDLTGTPARRDYAVDDIVEG